VTNEGRASLLSLIKSQGVLRASDAQVILGRGGQRGRWMLYLWPISMTRSGLDMLVEEMLQLVEPFEATQLAANGFGAVPLVTAMVQAGGGRYSGLIVRPETKKYGALRQVDGAGDRTRKVVVVDDSISSGTSFRRACLALEDQGYEVEGTACLVDFPGRGGRQCAEARGYRVETTFDIWGDIGMRELPLPGFVEAMPRVWSRVQVDDGLPAAVAARRVAEHYIDTGEALRPPVRFDIPESGAGGTFVSLRRRSDDYRVGRKGFWHFDPSGADPCRDVVIATVKTLRSMRRPPTRSELQELKFCVTFFGPLERVTPRELDFSRYGVVVRSRVTPHKMGGALPNTQFFTSTYEQYRHARSTNAKIMNLEDHEILRHELVKRVEPNESWPPYGEDARITDAWLDVPGAGDTLLDRVQEVVKHRERGEEAPPQSALPNDLFSQPIDAVVVTLYGRGVRGCGVGRAEALDDALVRAARGALGDKRFGFSGARGETTSWSVSLLHSPERVGVTSVEYIAKKFRRGLDSLKVEQQHASALYLDSVVVHHDWTKETTAKALLKKAGLSEGPFTWTTYKTAAWVRTPEGTFEQAGGNCRHAPGHALGPDDVALMAEHLMRRQDLDGWPAYGVRTLEGRYVRAGTAARCLHALRVLDLAGRATGREEWRAAARRGIDHALGGLRTDPAPILVLRDHRCGTAAEACLLSAVASAGHPALDSPGLRALADQLRSMVQPDGSVRTPGVTPSRSDADLFPGLALFSLAAYGNAVGDDLGLDWPGIRSWYMRRARLVRPWGLLSWQAQVWNLVGQLTGDDAHHAAAMELSDLMIEGQLSVDGSFLTDMGTSGPGFHTAFAAEGIAAGWLSALAVGAEEKAKLFRDSWDAAMEFCDQLIFRRMDTFWTPEPTFVLGGIRSTPLSSALRVDYTSHTLQALLAGLQAAERSR
jgi:AMMECR1 domain-containing protein